MLNMDVLQKGSKDLGIELDQEMLTRFSRYKDLLKEWNEKINITTITDDVEIDQKHFIDSITPLLTDYLKGSKKIIDIGTGGGFPGLPLKIVNKDLQVTLLDSLNKRIIFLNEVIKELNLQHIHAIHGRAEEYSRTDEYREKYDICISRAVASLDTLSEYCLPFVKVGGYFISMKGPEVDDELKLSKNAVNILGGKFVEVKKVTIPDTDITHSLIVIEKIKETSTKYPRGGGKPRKNPL